MDVLDGRVGTVDNSGNLQGSDVDIETKLQNINQYRNKSGRAGRLTIPRPSASAKPSSIEIGVPVLVALKLAKEAGF